MSSGTSTLESIALVALNELQRLSEGPENGGNGSPMVVGVPFDRDPHEWNNGNDDDGAIASMGGEGISSPDIGEAGSNGTTARGRDHDVVPAPRFVSLEGTPAGDGADTITKHPADAVATLQEAVASESVSSEFHGMGHQGNGEPEVAMPTTGPTKPEANDRQTDGATVATLPSSDGTGATVAAPAFSVSTTTGTAGPTDTSGDGAPFDSEFDPTSTADFSHILADPEAWLRSTENLYAALPPVDTKQHIPKVLADDVLCGRGGETNHHPGNVQYRSLVKAFQKLYIESKRRDKPKIAQCIVFTIRQVGGRFLKRTDPGANAWVDVGNTKAREKTSQALREGAPDLRGNEPSQQQDQESATASMDSGDDETPNPSTVASGYAHPSHSNSFDSSATTGGKGTAGAPPATVPHSVHGVVGGPNPTPATDVTMPVTMSERIAASLLQNPLFHRLSPFQQQQVLMSELAAARQHEQLHGFRSMGHGGHPVASSALAFPQHQLNHHRGFHDYATNDDIKLSGTPTTVHPSLDALYEEVLAAKLAIRKAAAEAVGASSVPTSSNGSVATFPSSAGVGNLLKRPVPASPYSAASSSPLRWNGTDGSAAVAPVIVSDSDGSVGSSLPSPSGNSTSSGGPRLKRLKMRRQQEVPAAVTSLQ